VAEAVVAAPAAAAVAAAPAAAAESASQPPSSAAAAEAAALPESSSSRIDELLSLYQGLPGALLKEGPPSAVYLGVYEAAKTRLLATPLLGPYPLLVYLLAGALGETFGSLLRAPAEAIKARVQSGADATTADSFQSVLGSAEGRANVKRAWSASLFRDVPFGAIQLALFEGLKSFLINSPETGDFNVDTLMAEAALGAIGGGIGALLTTPPDVVTVRILTQDVGEDGCYLEDDEGDAVAAEAADDAEADALFCPSTPPKGFLQMAREIVETDGPQGLMTGWTARVGYWAPAISIFLSCYCGIRQTAVAENWF